MSYKHSIATDVSFERKLDEWKVKLTDRLKGGSTAPVKLNPTKPIDRESARDEFDERLVMSSTVAY